jgi:hypothetical protein
VEELAAAVEFPAWVDGDDGRVSSDVVELAAADKLPTKVDGDEGREIVVATGVVLTSAELELRLEGAADVSLPRV